MRLRRYTTNKKFLIKSLSNQIEDWHSLPLYLHSSTHKFPLLNQNTRTVLQNILTADAIKPPVNKPQFSIIKKLLNSHQWKTYFLELDHEGKWEFIQMIEKKIYDYQLDSSSSLKHSQKANWAIQSDSIKLIIEKFAELGESEFLFGLINRYLFNILMTKFLDISRDIIKYFNITIPQPC